MQKTIIKKLIERFGQPYSEELGINLDRGKEEEVFKWFLASILFGKRIGEGIAKATYQEFKRARILSPMAILDTGWRGLVLILDTGGYVRYDFSTADNLLKTTETLLAEYGSLTNLYKNAKDPKDLERRLQKFRGVGPVTTNIFLREMRHIWPKAEPEINPYAVDAAKRLSIELKGLKKKTKDFIRLECALLRIGKNYIRKNKPLPIG